MQPTAIIALSTAVVLGFLPSVLIGEWKAAVITAAALLLMAVAGRVGHHLGRASTQTKQIYSDELDPLELEPSDAATATYDLTITNPDNTSHAHRSLTLGQLADNLDHHDVRTYLLEADAATVTAPNGHKLTWQPSTTDTTGDNR